MQKEIDFLGNAVENPVRPFVAILNQVSDDQYEVQVVSWYDNENSYTSQMVRTIKYFSELA